ncbi:ribonucleoside hydrolase RihC [Fructilactobacillus cliffordii]|uniref:Ribonucleoside hydrolase RihC n=1 Tax=Fructilactobacillus cliffordii TaxID=2940299 RepID=A0A9Q8ZST9_9LACO|nr:ribonucleoside hydrolase RihC [Fructilactobacillus cliffordii]USS88815.1 ribonucleoside hydrolase RihC [Fructilactobacillus cliffordii]
MERIIIDADPGIDDAAALAVAINHPDLDVQLITTVAGNVTVDKTTNNALKILEFFGKANQIPVAAGAEQPLVKPFEDAARIHGESGMRGYDFPEPTTKPVPQSAVTALHETIMNSPEPITLVPTGSYTNIGLLLAQYPEVKGQIKQIVAMGGTLGRGNMTSAAEFNVFTDPDAAKIMYQAGIPIVMIGLDVTMKALLTPSTLETINQMNRAGKMLHDIIISDGDQNAAGVAMHDVNTIFYLRHPESVTTTPYWIDIQTNGPALGETVADVRGAYHDGQTNALVGTDIDAAAFNRWFIAQVEQMD